MREHGFEAQEPYRGVKYPWRCLCHGCGTITPPTFGSILAGQSGCRRCADLRAGAARREDPERAAASTREAGLEPLEPYTTAMTPWRCRCTTCGRTSTPTLSKIRSGRRCKYCARFGFDRAAPARVYAVTHAQHGAVKIGVAGALQRNDRIVLSTAASDGLCSTNTTCPPQPLGIWTAVRKTPRPAARRRRRIVCSTERASSPAPPEPLTLF
ncbi:hypothetical protein [Streptomyces capoamus]|uniref:hypothetical protein n=1 Tax=Streptomyces capoamus TaxID=68183 RepID=UPI00339574AC